MDKDENYFLVGANFDGKDVTNEFISKGTWKLGWEDLEDIKGYKRAEKNYNLMKPGDKIAIKAAHTQKNNLPFNSDPRSTISIMDIKAKGTIKENLKDGHTVLVEWDKSFIAKKWYFYTYQPTVWKLNKNDERAKKLINFIESNEPQDYDWFKERYNKNNNMEIFPDNLITPSNFNYQFNFTNLLLSSKNIIFHGAPGTGKTYLAKQIAADIVSNGRTSVYTELTHEEHRQVGFVQFHPSYDYSDFVEGLRPTLAEAGQIGFELRNGIFKDFVESAQKSESINSIDNFKESWDKLFEKVSETDNYSLYTITGKEMKNMQVYERNGKQGIYQDGTTIYLNYDQIYNVYRGLPGTPKKGFDSYRRAIVKHLKEYFGLQDYQEGNIVTTDKKYVFIIDEINRGEISKIFGELFYSIDPGYRGEKGEVLTQYANLHEDPTEKFFIPENVYIIGTMNDIDRSVETFDFAMRRRFRFIDIKASERLEMLDNLGDKKEEALLRMERLNQSISEVSELNDNYHIGASYFLKLDHLSFDDLWTDYLAPLLEDYVNGLFEKDALLEQFQRAYGFSTEVEGDIDDIDNNQ